MPSRELPFAQRTLAEILTLQARLGARPLIDAPGMAGVTYADAPELAARIAGALSARGVRPGDRVVVMAGNRTEQLCLWMGVAWAGAILVPFNTAFRGEQLRHALRIAEPVALVCDADCLPLFAGCADLLRGLRLLWTFGAGAQATQLAGVQGEAWGCLDDPIPAHPASPDTPVAILYTSGTSGASKAVVCPHGQFFWWGVLTGEALGLTAEDRLRTTLPLAHINALNTFWQALLHGAGFSLSPRFSASAFWQEMRATRATVTYLLGAMVNILMSRPPAAGDRDHSLRIALAPGTSRDVVTAFHERFGVRLVEGYGSTETNLVMSNVQGGPAPGTMGRPLPEFAVRVVDDNGDEVTDNRPGQLLVHGHEPCSMAGGYFRDPEATARAWRDGWFHTGDRVIRRSDGTHEFVDRMKDAIRRRGENISSWEVEQALLGHGDIESTAVIGVPSELGEEEVMAFVVLRAGAAPEPEALVRHLETRIAYFAIPRYIEFVDTLPVTDNGKITKVALRERGVGTGTWDRERAGITLNRR